MGEGGWSRVPKTLLEEFNVCMAYLTIQSIFFVHDFGESTVNFLERHKSGPELRFWLRIGLEFNKFMHKCAGKCPTQKFINFCAFPLRRVELEVFFSSSEMYCEAPIDKKGKKPDREKL